MDKQFSTDDYNFIAQLLFKTTGMDLGDNKGYLLESRLKDLWESLKLKNISELIQYLRQTPDPKIIKLVGERMTTNETLFFRDQLPYDFLRSSIIPEVHKRTQGNELKIWSAACSTGQEPYSIAIILEEERKRFHFQKVQILATDIALSVLEKAKQGVFSKYELGRGMPPELQEKYMVPKGLDFEMKPELKKNISFQECNLMHFQLAETFDCIFLRNVLIYFDLDSKRKIVETAFKMLHPQGYLFLGAAETMMGISEKFSRVENVNISVYRKLG